MQPTRVSLLARWSWLALLLLLLPAAQAYTDPSNFNKLVAFRESMKVRSSNWAAAIATWTCPTPPGNTSPAGVCDPCGNSYDGNWYHMHCRGNTRGWGESGDGTNNGITTNMHITSSLVDGPVPKELCIIPTLREHDFGGQLNRGHLTGPFPHWLAKCYPALEELDLSNNRLTGTIPPYLGSMEVLTEIKLENNALIGTVPPEIGNLPRLRRFQTEFNNMRGVIPATFKNFAPYLTQFHIARNDYEGDLSMLAGGHITTATVHDNPKLCGMVPATIRFAKGYNPGNTNLGKPCGGSSGVLAPAAASSAARAPAPQPMSQASTETDSATNAAQNITGAGDDRDSADAASPSPASQASDAPLSSAAADSQQGAGSSGQQVSPAPDSSSSNSGNSGFGSSDSGADDVNTGSDAAGEGVTVQQPQALAASPAVAAGGGGEEASP